MYCKNRLVMAGIMALTLMAPTIAMAAPKPAAHGHRYYDLAEPNYASTEDLVFLGGVEIMRFRVGAGGFSAHERAVETQERLNMLLGQGPIYPSDITTEMVGPDAVVLVKGILLFTADADTASLNDATPMDLANTWADRMRGVLPGLTSPN
jgi:hypothetical protein